MFSECPSYDQLVPAMLAHGLQELPTHCHFVPGVPLEPMLAKPTTGVQEVLTRFTDVECSCEYKYDGERAQVHVLEDGSVRATAPQCKKKRRSSRARPEPCSFPTYRLTKNTRTSSSASPTMTEKYKRWSSADS